MLTRIGGTAVVCAIVVALAAGGCADDGSGSDSPTPPVTPTIVGRWDGSTGQNLPVAIRVGSTSVIDSLTVRLTATFGGSSCTATIVKLAVPVAADGRFEATLGIGFSTTIRGHFTSASAATGTIDAYSGSFAALCGNTVLMGTGATLGGTQWSATKR
jgi:hypothetical protein